MRRTVTTAIALAGLALIAGCGPTAVDPQAAASAASRSSEQAAAEARRVAANSAASASSSAAAAASSSAAAAASASEAAASEAAAAASSAAAQKPRVYTGSGDSVVKIDKPGDGSICLATITGNKASSLFAVKGVDGERDLLVNTTDPYSGTVLLDARSGGTTELQVSAKGPWSITLAPISTAPDLNSGANTGTGDAVLKYLGSTGVATITGNKARSLFAIWQFTGTGSDLLVNTTDPYAGSVPLSAGPALLQVSATGAWTINAG